MTLGSKPLRRLRAPIAVTAVSLLPSTILWLAIRSASWSVHSGGPPTPLLVVATLPLLGIAAGSIWLGAECVRVYRHDSTARPRLRSGIGLAMSLTTCTFAWISAPGSSGLHLGLIAAGSLLIASGEVPMFRKARNAWIVATASAICLATASVWSLRWMDSDLAPSSEGFPRIVQRRNVDIARLKAQGIPSELLPSADARVVHDERVSAYRVGDDTVVQYGANWTRLEQASVESVCDSEAGPVIAVRNAGLLTLLQLDAELETQGRHIIGYAEQAALSPLGNATVLAYTTGSTLHALPFDANLRPGESVSMFSRGNLRLRAYPDRIQLVAGSRGTELVGNRRGVRRASASDALKLGMFCVALTLLVFAGMFQAQRRHRRATDASIEDGELVEPGCAAVVYARGARWLLEGGTTRIRPGPVTLIQPVWRPAIPYRDGVAGSLAARVAEGRAAEHVAESRLRFVERLGAGALSASLLFAQLVVSMIS